MSGAESIQINDGGPTYSIEYDTSDSDESCLSCETIYDEPDTSVKCREPHLKECEPTSVTLTLRHVNQVEKYYRLAEIMRLFSKNPTIQFEKLFQECKTYFHFPLFPEQEKILKQRLSTFKTEYTIRWKKSRRKKTRFLESEKKWLNNYLTVPQDWFNLDSPAIKTRNKFPKVNACGPVKIPGQRKKYHKLGKRGQQKAVQKITQKLSVLPTAVILKSTAQILSKRNEKSSAMIINKIQKGDFSAADILKKLRIIESTPRPFTADEALSLLLELKLSQSGYKFLKKQANKRNSKIFPSYHAILNAKKFCHPVNIIVDESSARVPLQDLLNHTANRIVMSHEKPILASMDAATVPLKYTLVGIYGFDGSSSQSRYNQKFSQSATATEENLFATTFSPMRLLSCTGHLLWQNPAPQSTRYCRPLKLEYVKETTAIIQRERDDMYHAIEKLSGVTIKLDNKDLLVTFDLRLTAIDGKALQAITGVTTSSQCCPLCGANPKSFNNLENLKNEKFKPKFESLVHGISPLHCWLRFLEFCLKLAYRKPAGVYPVTKDKHKKMYDKTKAKIQQEFRTQMGLLVDMVKQGFGTTNSGNTARTCFRNHQDFARILDIDHTFVFNLYIILVTMSSEFSINSKLFGDFCLKTFKQYVSFYPWHPLSATVHKVLIHGSSVIEHSILPLGMMGEDAAESRNKFYRSDRQHHARQMDRIVNLTDVFNRALESSDPLISSHFTETRKCLRKKQSLPTDVLSLLDEPKTLELCNALPNYNEIENVSPDDDLSETFFDLVLENEENDD